MATRVHTIIWTQRGRNHDHRRAHMDALYAISTQRWGEDQIKTGGIEEWQVKASVRPSQQSNQILQWQVQEAQCAFRPKDELDGFVEEESIQPPHVVSVSGCLIHLDRFIEQLICDHQPMTWQRVQEPQPVCQQHPVKPTSKPLIGQKARFEDANMMKQRRLRPHT